MQIDHVDESILYPVYITCSNTIENVVIYCQYIKKETYYKYNKFGIRL